MGWSGHQEWRFERVTLEAPVRYPRGNNAGSGVFRVRNSREGLIWGYKFGSHHEHIVGI